MHGLRRVAPEAGSVVGENIVAYEIAYALAEKFGGDSLSEMKRNYRGYVQAIKS